MYKYEEALLKRGYRTIAGTDEVGRGPLAGPLVCAAVILDPHNKIEGLNDSKKLSEKKREFLFDEIKKKAIAFSIDSLQQSSELFVSPGDDVYEGMIIGENVLESNIEMNAVKAKATTNIRVTEAVQVEEGLSPPRLMGLEDAIAYIRSDELVEVTPKYIRMRKQVLSQSQRGTLDRKAKNEK